MLSESGGFNDAAENVHGIQQKQTEARASASRSMQPIKLWACWSDLHEGLKEATDEPREPQG